MKNKKVYFEICIIGSGLIGLVMALMLSKLNLKILLIDKTNVLNKKKKHCDDRTTAISQGTKRIFDSLGFWKRLELFAQPIKKILVHDEISESLEFDSKMRGLSTGFELRREDSYNPEGTTAKTFFFQKYGVASTTFEIGDNTPNDFIELYARTAAETLMSVWLQSL